MQTLATDEIAKSYRGRRVVNGVSLHINQAEVVGLLGPNGAGKTTTFYMTVGLVPPDSGRILVDGQDISHGPMCVRASTYGISYLPQERSVFRKLRVEENIMAVLEVQPICWQERRKKRDQLIDELGLGHIRNNMGYALSGGERRRVEIARALCIAPKFILLDEPFSGIDPIAVLDLQKIIFDLKGSGIGVLITDHNVRETLSVTDRAYIINEGRIFRTGTPEQLGNDPEVKRVYLGELDSSVPLLDEVAGREEAHERQDAKDIKEKDETGPEAEKKDPFDEIDFGSFFRDYLDPGYRNSADLEEIDRPSFENFLSKPGTLTDHLIWQLGSLSVR